MQVSRDRLKNDPRETILLRNNGSCLVLILETIERESTEVGPYMIEKEKEA